MFGSLRLSVFASLRLYYAIYCKRRQNGWKTIWRVPAALMNQRLYVDVGIFRHNTYIDSHSCRQKLSKNIRKIIENCWLSVIYFFFLSCLKQNLFNVSRLCLMKLDNMYCVLYVDVWQLHLKYILYILYACKCTAIAEQTHIYYRDDYTLRWWRTIFSNTTMNEREKTQYI